MKTATEATGVLTHMRAQRQCYVNISTSESEAASNQYGEWPLSRRAVWVMSIVGAAGLLFALVMGATAYRGRTASRKGLPLLTSSAFRCESDDESDTLTLVEEAKMKDLFGNGEYKYEASDVVYKDGQYYVICDSSWSVWRVDEESLAEGTDDGNDEIAHIHREGEHLHGGDEDSGYEALWFDPKDRVFYIVRESLPHPGTDGFHSHIEKVRLSGPGEERGGGRALLGNRFLAQQDDVGHDLIEVCRTEDEFVGDNKGLEGVMGIRDGDGELYLLGLCEGNNCMAGEEGQDEGHGVILIMKRKEYKNGSCGWITVRRMRVPRNAEFTDYSAIAYDMETGMVAITSQEDSSLWVGRMRHGKGSHTFDPHTSYLDEGRVYRFPRSDKCNIVYCNIEGVDWIDPRTVVAVSDKVKQDKQNPRCAKRDQSVHVFTLPE